jgi:hypothetical protein
MQQTKLLLEETTPTPDEQELKRWKEAEVKRAYHHGKKGGRDTRIAFPAMSRERYLEMGNQHAWWKVDPEARAAFLRGWNEHVPEEETTNA